MFAEVIEFAESAELIEAVVFVEFDFVDCFVVGFDYLSD